MSKTLGVIPARYGSTRYPGKPLALILDKPMIQHVYERCQKAKLLDEVVVATDDKRIMETVADFGGKAVMTARSHASGTDRVAEVVKSPAYRNFKVVLNVQGDEPLVDPKAIDQLARQLLNQPDLEMATIATGFTAMDDLNNPNSVKLVADDNDHAIYFSRSVIPHTREREDFKLTNYLRHIGMYGYRREFLLRYITWPQGRLERAERLEQLRALEHGVRIKVVTIKHQWSAVDTPEDLSQLNQLLFREKYG